MMSEQFIDSGMRSDQRSKDEAERAELRSGCIVGVLLALYGLKAFYRVTELMGDGFHVRLDYRSRRCNAWAARALSQTKTSLLLSIFNFSL
jgi:hypothetical protein